MELQIPKVSGPVLRPHEVKRIGIAMSGGCDSSLLFYLLYRKIIDEDIKDVTLHPLIFCHIDRPSMIKPVYDVIMKVNPINDIVKTPQVGYVKYKTTEYLKEFLDPVKRNVDIITRGTTRNPPIEVMPGDQKDRAWERPKDDLINVENEWMPFTNMHKQGLALIYKMYDLKEIFELTVSCIGHFEKTNGFTKPCENCWWCYEKKWAFNTFDNEWLI
jgi:hypothetical protein